MADGAGQRTGKRKMLDGDVGRKLLVGEHVEICYFEEGLTGSWHSGVVVKCGKSYRMVEHANLLNEERNGKEVEKIPVSAAIEGSSKTTLKYCRDQIRPFPPTYDIQKRDVRYGLCVDALIEQAWWEGVIFDHEEGSEKRNVFFPDLGDQDIVPIDRLRLTQDWNGVSGDWTLRGEWLLLHLLQDLEQKEGLLVSIRQVWYDLRTKPAYPERVKAWYLGAHDVWQELVSELFQELKSVIYGNPPPEVVGLMQLENFHTFSDVIDEPMHMVPSQGNIDFDGWVDNPNTITPVQLENLLTSPGAIDVSTDGIPCHGTDFRLDALLVNLDSTLPLDQHSPHNLSLSSSRCSSELMTLHGNSHDETCFGSLVTACESRKPSAGDLDHAVNSSFVANIDVSIFGENKVKINSSSEVSKDWKTLELKSDYCPDVLSMYAYSLEDGKTKQKSSKQSCSYHKHVSLKLKMHILALGWKIDFRYDRMLRYRYRSPEGKTLYSLPQVYNYLMKEHTKNVEDTQHTSEKDLLNTQGEPTSVACDSSALIKRTRYLNAYVGPTDLQVGIEGKLASGIHVAEDAGSSVFTNSSCPEYRNSILCVEDAGSSVFRESISPESQNTRLCVGLQHASLKEVDAELRKMENVHPEYLPEAIKEYEDYIDSLRQSKASNVDVSLLRLNAKKHLSYMGWHFWLKTKKTKIEMCYEAPSGRCYGSLTQACKAYLTANKLKIAYESPQEQMSITDSSNFQIDDSKKIEKHEFCSSSNLVVTGIQESAKSSKIADTRCSRTRSLKGPPLSSAFALRSRKRTGQVMSPFTKDSSKTILSWLINKNVVLPRQNVYYMSKDGISKKKGRISGSGQGIKCTCCGQLFTLTKFEAHAGYKTRHPCANIFLDDGRSLLHCQLQIMDSSRYKDVSHRRVKGDYSYYPSDVICSICHYGGDMILCDHCPSSFHISCLGLKEVPEGRWFCPSCKCGLCGVSEYNHDIMQFTMQTILYCDQCEQEYHVGCLRQERSQQLSYCPTEKWFCSKKCSKIYNHLHGLLGKSNPASVDGLSWTILKWQKGGRVSRGSICPESSAAIHTKLSIALDVLHECFVTIIEPRTQTDLSSDIVFNQESELNRLNFWGFYTVLLEKEDEVVSVAIVRVHDEKVAEMPLIGTSLKFRRQGMCRLIVNEVEKLLYALGVERLLLPAAPQLVETWTNSFGFTKVENSDRIELLRYQILNFQETTMCQKFLRVAGSVSRK